MRGALMRIGDVRLVRYLLASVGALAADVGCFLALLGLGVAAAPASAVGYALGIAVHWVLSSRAVFADSVAAGGLARTRQKALFVVSALIGLALTTPCASSRPTRPTTTPPEASSPRGPTPARRSRSSTRHPLLPSAPPRSCGTSPTTA
ncbi:GtrA family protein [Leptolyngbya sp. 15MV]|nr:GtrA family protein [Leptolyngbya sp. 15MV]